MRNNDPGSNAIVIRTAEQILPYCVVRTEHRGGNKYFGKPKKTFRPARHPHPAPPQPQSQPPSTTVHTGMSKTEGYQLAAYVYTIVYFLFAAVYLMVTSPRSFPRELFYIGAAAVIGFIVDAYYIFVNW